MKIEWEWTICLIFMTICVITDIRKKEIPVIVVALSGGCALLYTIILGEKEWSEILYSLLPGACLLFLGLCTKESIGYGDGLAATPNREGTGHQVQDGGGDLHLESGDMQSPKDHHLQKERPNKPLIDHAKQLFGRYFKADRKSVV